MTEPMCPVCGKPVLLKGAVHEECERARLRPVHAAQIERRIKDQRRALVAARRRA